MGQQRTQVAHMLGRNPNLGKHVGTQQLSQGQHIDFVSLDRRVGNQLDLGGVGDNHTSNQRDHLIIDQPSIGGGLKHDGISGKQIGLGPFPR